MSTDQFKNRFRIQSARANWHNYNDGTYFVTICTHGRVHYFGKIGDIRFDDRACHHQRNFVETFHETSLKQKRQQQPTMILSSIGLYADEQLRNVHTHYTYAEIPLWVVMPDHVHAIVMIDHNKIPHEKRNSVGTFHDQRRQQQLGNPIQIATQMQTWLSVVIRQFKQSVTRFANKQHIPFAWQTRFHDHIIRNTNELNRIAAYIENNVIRWGQGHR